MFTSVFPDQRGWASVCYLSKIIQVSSSFLFSFFSPNFLTLNFFLKIRRNKNIQTERPNKRAKGVSFRMRGHIDLSAGRTQRLTFFSQIYNFVKISSKHYMCVVPELEKNFEAIFQIVSLRTPETAAT